MNLGNQASEESGSWLATARYDRESATRNRSTALNRPGHPLRLAMIFHIPVGYQDETGFHPGKPRLYQVPPTVEPEDNIKSENDPMDTYKF